MRVMDVQAKVAAQVEQELATYGLEIVATPMGKALRAGKAIADERRIPSESRAR